MSDRVEVLDHGFVTLIETWGSDERIIESARMSTQKGFEGWSTSGGKIHRSGCEVAYTNEIVGPCNCPPGDEKLLRYLWEHKHATPFEMAGAVVEVQAPIFVFREWHRHRTQSYNEMSARYAPLPDVNYVPSSVRLLMNAGGTNKQAGTVKGAAELTDENAGVFQDKLRKLYADAQALYTDALGHGVPKELARLCLPVGRYSKMRASANLRNWLGFLALRMDPAAQWEIRKFAEAVHDMLAVRFPRTLALFQEGQR